MSMEVPQSVSPTETPSQPAQNPRAPRAKFGQRGRGGARGDRSRGDRPRGRGRGANFTAVSAQQYSSSSQSTAAQDAETQAKLPEPRATTEPRDGEVSNTDPEGVEADVCFICASPVVHNSIAPCNHWTCHICALRLRALYKTKACAHCRVSYTKPFPAFSLIVKLGRHTPNMSSSRTTRQSATRIADRKTLLEPTATLVSSTRRPRSLRTPCCFSVTTALIQAVTSPATAGPICTNMSRPSTKRSCGRPLALLHTSHALVPVADFTDDQAGWHQRPMHPAQKSLHARALAPHAHKSPQPLAVRRRSGSVWLQGPSRMRLLPAALLWRR